MYSSTFCCILEVCKFLKVTKIPISNNGLTPLYIASGTGKYEVCKILLKAWRKEDFKNVTFVILTSHKMAKKYNWRMLNFAKIWIRHFQF